MTHTLATPSKSPRLLVVEDENDLREAMVTYLGMEGFSVQGVGSLAAADHWLAKHQHDILILDLVLPDGNGLEWLAARPSLRKGGVVITTARGLVTERVAGIKTGADTYLVKPVQMEELAAVLNNLLHRMDIAPPEKWLLNTRLWTLTAPNGNHIKLTHSEARLLRRFALSPGQPVDRDDLIQQLGCNPEHYDMRRLEVLVRRLRAKASNQLDHPFPLTTVQKQGYAFTAEITVHSGV